MSFLTTWHRPINTSVEIDDVLDKFFAFPMQRPAGPASNVQTTDIGHQISLVVPGVPKDEIGIDINNNRQPIVLLQSLSRSHGHSLKMQTSKGLRRLRIMVLLPFRFLAKRLQLHREEQSQ